MGEKGKQGTVGKEIINFWTMNFNNEDILQVQYLFIHVMEHFV